MQRMLFYLIQQQEITLKGNKNLDFDSINLQKKQHWKFINPIKYIATTNKSYYEHQDLKVNLSPNGFGVMLSCNSNFIGRIRTTEIDIKNDTFAHLIFAICCVNSIRNYVYNVNESNA